MDPFDWECPYCNRATTITDNRVHSGGSWFTIENADGPRYVGYRFIVCPNKNCRKFTFSVHLYNGYKLGPGDWRTSGVPENWQLIPPSKAKVFPAYIPEAILSDYKEACLISNLSPKASATLSRRCLQGILRDFWKVKAGKLINEIKQIQGKVDPLTWDAIDAVRRVGNIGAHMEKDVNEIVEVEPNEADLLIGLIETLFKDWYIAREEKKSRLTQITEMADKKS